MIAGVLLVTMATAFSRAQALAFPVAQTVHPAGCHSHGPVIPAPVPTRYQCCASGHHEVIPAASFRLRCNAAHLWSLTGAAVARMDFISSLQFEEISDVSNSPPSAAPLRI
jgi:hypothetical protein